MKLNLIKSKLAVFLVLITLTWVVGSGLNIKSVFAQDTESQESEETTMQRLDNITNLFKEITSLNLTDSDPELAPEDAASGSATMTEKVGSLTQFTYDFPEDEVFRVYGSDVKNNPALNAIFNEVASHVGIPAKYLRAIMTRECPTTFSLSAQEVAQYSSPGGEIPFCKDADPPNFSDGPMQFLDTYWPAFAVASDKYGGYKHEPKVGNIRDSVYAAAMALKENVIISEEGQRTGVWIRQDVINAVGCYATGACKRQVDYNSLASLFRGYVDTVWGYYSAN